MVSLRKDGELNSTCRVSLLFSVLRKYFIKHFFLLNFNLIKGEQGFRVLRAQSILRQKKLMVLHSYYFFTKFSVKCILKVPVIWRNKGADDKQQQEDRHLEIQSTTEDL